MFVDRIIANHIKRLNEGNERNTVGNVNGSYITITNSFSFFHRFNL